VADLELFDLYALTQSTYTKTTRMPFRTTSGPYLTVISSPGASPFRFSFPAIVGRSYQIQFSSNLVNWTTARTTNAATTQVIYEEQWLPGAGPKFLPAWSALSFWCCREPSLIKRSGGMVTFIFVYGGFAYFCACGARLSASSLICLTRISRSEAGRLE